MQTHEASTLMLKIADQRSIKARKLNYHQRNQGNFFQYRIQEDS